MNRQVQNPMKLQLESLEDRTLLAASLIRDNLVIDGTSGGDSVLVQNSPTNSAAYRVSFNGQGSEFAKSRVTGLLVFRRTTKRELVLGRC